ncbi:NUDIX domain-containing protein [Flavobacterium sp.]|uniref:NUDIX hydrolase n=1 Tax=Flavobacterium sp. TaxID=239 RepID=UPI00263040EC|nr:NUDIX domain-containing protein [Flavobacterium sp.]
MAENEASFFKYCPNCSSQNLTYVNNFKLHCSDCDFILYHNIAAAVALVFTYEDKILFAERNVEPDKGKLDLPGGFIDPNETAEEAACREVNEELGLELTPDDLKYITTAPNNYLYRNVPYRTMDIFYECSLKTNVISIKAADEIKSLTWIKRNEIDLNKIGFASIRKVIGERYLV